MNTSIRSCVILLMLLLASLFSQGQNIIPPQFLGIEETIQNYFFSKLVSMQKIISKTCDTSSGMIEFYVSENGNVEFLTIPSNFPKEVHLCLEEIIRSSTWTPMKIDGKNVRSLPIILPVYISIEMGCENGIVKDRQDYQKDISNVLEIFQNGSLKNCLLLRPFTYFMPYGYTDLNPIKK